MTVSVTDLVAPGGAKIPAEKIDLCVSRSKGMNHDAVYTIEPRFLDKLPKVGIAIQKGITRSFWAMLQAARAAKPEARSSKPE